MTKSLRCELVCTAHRCSFDSDPLRKLFLRNAYLAICVNNAIHRSIKERRNPIYFRVSARMPCISQRIFCNWFHTQRIQKSYGSKCPPTASPVSSTASPVSSAGGSHLRVISEILNNVMESHLQRTNRLPRWNKDVLPSPYLFLEIISRRRAAVSPSPTYSLFD